MNKTRYKLYNITNNIKYIYNGKVKGLKRYINYLRGPGFKGFCNGKF